LHIIIALVAGDVGKPVSSLTKVDNQKRQVKQWSIDKTKKKQSRREKYHDIATGIYASV
jgi:hypothetical protein